MTRHVSRGLYFVASIALLVSGASAEDTDAYKFQQGPLEIADAEISLDMPSADRTLQMRLVYPKVEGIYPVIVFSHGGAPFEYLASYSHITDHWASHGYVVVRPVHLDALATNADIGELRRQAAEGIDPVTEARIEDVSFIVDSLDEIQSAVPDLAGKPDPERLIIAGHSRGSAIALRIMGVEMINPNTGQSFGTDDDRFDAVIFLSEPGNAVFMPYQPWRAIEDKPSLVVTGSNDFGSIAGRPIGIRYQVVSKGLSGTDKRHLLYIQDLDQRWGGLIRGEDEFGKGADYDALDIIRGTTTAFLDAYIKSDGDAEDFLDSREVEVLSKGRAALSN